MDIKISQRAREMEPSATIQLFSKAKKMMAEGIDVVNFGVGEPDFNTPKKVKEAGIKAIEDDFLNYTVTTGIPELKEQIINKLQEDNQLKYNEEEIIVTPGAKAALAESLAVLCDPGDEIFIPAPYWVSYPPQVDLVRGKPVIIKSKEKNDFKITAKQLEQAMKNADSPTALILNYPNNPTGAIYNKEELAQIAEVCYENDVMIISDEIYEKLIYGSYNHTSIASIDDDIKEITIVINGVSKAYAMTGWRLGYAAARKEIIDSMGKIQGQTASCVTGISQKAAVEALQMEDEELEGMVNTFKERRDYLVDELNKIGGVNCNLPKGAFYAFPNVSEYIKGKKGIDSTEELSQYLLNNYRVAIVPGSAFGKEGNLRFSYATSMENIKEGIARFAEGLKSL